MDKRQRQLIEAYRRIQRFLRSNPALAPASYAKASAILNEVVARLTELSVAQVDGMRQSVGETRKLEALVRALRDDHLWPLVVIARVHASDKPGIDKVLTMPDGALAPLYQLAEARQIRDAARPHVEDFVSFGLPEDFLELLSAAIDEVEAALGGRAAQTGTHIGARAGIEKELKRGRDAVMVLDRLVRKAFRGNAVALASWRAAKRVQALPTKSESESEAEAGTVAA